VAGIIGALNNDIGIVGVMPGASLYSVKVFDSNGEGSLSDIILGLQWCIANDIKIVNMSFGSSEENNSFRQVFANAERAGIIMVAAAGNDRTQHKMQYPALYDETIAVSALSQMGMIASFSSYGDKVDVIAPGENIKSTWKDGSYKEESGTSMATPFVTGAIAQMINKWGEMTPAQAKRHLQRCCTMLPMPQIYQGAGLINLKSLLNSRP
ncbi:MAG: S8 family peptidase, partial [Syntrophomonadaceae bacterium]|nr:S8 family peptidase [Syntrophomonadaceae bacterium]